jgi:methyl-accepting chemotaxis protein
MKLFKKKEKAANSPATEKERVQSLSKRLIQIIAILLVAAVVIVATISTACMSRVANRVAQEAASADLGVMQNEYQSIAKQLEINANAIAANADIMNAVQNKSSSSAVLTLSELSRALDVDSVTVFSNDAKVVTSTSKYVFGDDMNTVAGVREAMSSGTATMLTGPSAEYTYAINEIVPIMKNSKVMGGILLSYDLADSDFVDSLKVMTGNEFTVFAGDTILSTTILDESGNRAVGTQMSESIAKVVLEQGETYTGKAKLFGIRYITCYAPIFSNDGSVSGALFTGYNMSSYYANLYFGIGISFLVAAGLMVVALITSTRFMRRRLKKPLDNVILAVNDIASGEMTDETTAALEELATKDEIGHLARSMEQAVSSVRKISTDTQYLSKAMEQRDLTVTVDTDSHQGIYKVIADVVCKLFDEIANNMREIQKISNGINDRTVQVSEAAQSLAQGSTEQAGSVEELAATINSIVTQVNENASNAKNASDASQKAEQEVLRSNEQMVNMTAAMDEIEKTSERIGSIVKTIDDLAFQTNILALNAAVEAARAGSAGKGFAVVADEVQNLAGKSAAAAKDTAELIESALGAIKKGTQYANNASDGLKNVVGQTTQVNKMVTQIADAATDEAQLLGQVSEGIEQISVVVQTNSSIAEETAAASQGLNADTKELNDMVNRYKLK